MPLELKENSKFDFNQYRIKAEDSLFLIIGATDISNDYTVSVPGVLKDLDNIKNLFTSSLIGIPEENVEIAINSNKTDVQIAFSKVIRKRNWNTIILYYGGIGLVNNTEESLLELVLNDKSVSIKNESPSQFDREQELHKITYNPDFIEEDSKISIKEINQLFKGITSNVILLLDCGNSELGFKDFYCQNMVVLSATDGKSKTLDTQEGGIYTIALNHILEKGINNGKKGISFQDLYIELRRKMTSEYNIEPKFMTSNLTQYLNITNNRITLQSTLEPEVKEEKPKVLSELKDLISKNELKSVFEGLKSLLSEDNDFLNQVIVQQNKYERITKYHNLRIIKEDDYEVFHNQIVYGLLSLIDEKENAT